MLYGQHHNHVIISERILIIIVKFDYEPANLQHKFYKWVLLTLGLVEVCVLFGAEKLLVAQSVKMFPATFEPECQVPYLSEAATYRFFTRIHSTYTHLISYISILILFLLLFSGVSSGLFHAGFPIDVLRIWYLTKQRHVPQTSTFMDLWS